MKTARRFRLAKRLGLLLVLSCGLAAFHAPATAVRDSCHENCGATYNSCSYQADSSLSACLSMAEASMVGCYGSNIYEYGNCRENCLGRGNESMCMDSCETMNDNMDMQCDITFDTSVNSCTSTYVSAVLYCAQSYSGCVGQCY